jgi:predicted O-methyltransferase YrrM
MSFELDLNIIYPNDPTASPERIEQYKEYYKVKYNICKEANPQVIAEIGVRAGYSAWAFLQACPNAKYIGIDADNGTHGGSGGEDGSFNNWARKILEPYQCEFLKIDTQKTDDLNVHNVDMFHVDGDHTVEGVQHDLDLALKSLNDGGIIIVDDIDYIPSVKEGTHKWINKTQLKFKYIKSLRGEYVIFK